MFAMLLIGASDFARVFYAAVGVSGIATNGAEWLASSVANSALADSNTNATTIRNAAIVETSTLDGATTTSASSVAVTASRTCTCTGSTASDCTGTATACSDPNPRQIMVSVTASFTYVPLIRYPGLPQSIPISYTSVMRAQ